VLSRRSKRTRLAVKKRMGKKRREEEGCKMDITPLAIRIKIGFIDATPLATDDEFSLARLDWEEME
jgi:hypothetical protein